MVDHDFITRLAAENCYLSARALPAERYAAVNVMLYGHASIIVGKIGDYTGWDDVWFYHSLSAAIAALDAWDGTGEPAGWYRNPPTGRRISQSPDEYDEDGDRVGAIGVTYVRW